MQLLIISIKSIEASFLFVTEHVTEQRMNLGL